MTEEPTWTCPHCGSTESPLGVEVPRVYEGVLFWVCRSGCGKAWSQDWSDMPLRRATADSLVKQHNNRVASNTRGSIS